jgi:chromosome segregation ATPase
MTTEDDIETVERESATTGALLRRIDERVASVAGTCRDIVDELARVGQALIDIETWKSSAELRIRNLERDTEELRDDVRTLRFAAERRNSALGSLDNAAEEAEKNAILRALKESRLDHEKSRKRLALQNLVAFIVIVAGIVLRTVLFGGH